MKRYLVTGGAGFIGSNIVKRLTEDHHDVYVLDDFSTGDMDNLPGRAALTPMSYKEALKVGVLGELDGILHLGAHSNSLIYRDNSTRVAESIGDFLEVLEYCRRTGTRLTYVSSSSIYNGNPTPWNEEMRLYPKDFYTESRIAFERLAQCYYEHYGVKSIGMRMFSVYGPGEGYKGIYANLLTQLFWAKQADEEFVVYGDAEHGYGNQRRDTIYVDDVVDAWMLAKDSDINRAVFNIGTGVSYSLNEMNELIGAKLVKKENPINPNYVWETLADTRNAEKYLGFEAKITLAEGIELMEEAYGKLNKVS